MSITTVTLIKSNYLNIPDSSLDTQLGEYLTTAEALCKRICGQPIAQETVVDDFTAHGGLQYELHYIKVPVTLTSLQYRQEPDESFTTVTGAVIYKANGLYGIYNPSGFSQRFYRSTLSVGYGLSDAPDDLVNVVSEMVVELFNQTSLKGAQKNFGVSAIAKTEGGLTVTTTYKDMMTRYRQRLQPYKVRSWR